MRKLWIALIVVVVLVVVVAVAVPLLVDPNRYRGLIQSRAEQALGRDVQLGEIKLSLLPFGVRVDSLSIGSLPGEGPGELLTARRLRVGARLLPLLSKQLDVTSITVESPQITIARGPDGQWNVQRLVAAPAGGEPTAADDAGAPSFVLRNLRLTDGRVVLRDAGGGRETPFEATLKEIDLRVEELALDRPIDFQLAAAVAQYDVQVAVSGKLGPFDSVTAGVPVDVDVELRDVPLASVGSLLGEFAPSSGQARLVAKLSGHAPQNLDAQGSLTIDGATVRHTPPGGKPRDVKLDVRVQYDVGVREAGAEIDLEDVRVELAGNRVSLRGQLRQRDATRWVDLEVLRSSIPAQDLAQLMALVGIEPPVEFSSSEPIEFDARLRGELGGTTPPQIEANAKLRGFTISHASLTQPVEQVGADVALRGERIKVTGLAGVIGSNDIAGELEVQGFDAPRVRFDLRSRKADIGELFSFLVAEEETPASAAEEASDPLAALRMDGTLRIERGSFQTLDFTALDATVAYVAPLLTLDPLVMQLYDGSFKGRIASDLGREPPTFDVSGDVTRLDLDAFMADNLEMPNLLAGRFTGRIATRGSGLDYESIVRSLEGTGTMEVDEGRLGGLNVLSSLSKVSGVFGESTLKSLTGTLASEGTAFDELSSKLLLSGGQLQLEDLRFRAPQFALSGAGRVDLLSTEMRGAFRLSFAKELSAAMRAEGSRAAKLFYDSRSGQVELPFTLSGPYTAPRPSIDFAAVAESRAKGEILDQLTERLGLGGKPPAKPAPDPTSPPAEGSPPEPPAAARTHPDLGVEFGSPRWRGSILARDLEVPGSVVGKNLAKATLVVTDADGRELERFDPLPEVAAWVDATADRAVLASVPWRVKVKGERLAIGKAPFTVTVTVSNAAGESAQADLRVER